MQPDANTRKRLRILAVSRLKQGTNDYAFVRAFRRAGHSVKVAPYEQFIPTWHSKSLRLLRRLLKPILVHEYETALVKEAQQLQPDLFFVFKGEFLRPETMWNVKKTGAIAINFYPDVSFRTSGPYLPRTLPHYDWVFTTKSFGLIDMREQLGVQEASFLPHAFDPETHFPVELDDRDIAKYACDISFIGNHSPKKQEILEYVHRKIPSARFFIWGPNSWRRASNLREIFRGEDAYGREYAKAIQASAVNIAILSEKRKGASSGDLITARTFEIPAVGGFMLHERTEEAMAHFEDGRECALFSDPDELVRIIRYYLAHPEQRVAIAEAGRRRALTSGYSVDARSNTVLEKYQELRDRQF